MAEAEVRTTTTGYPMPGDVLDERYRLDEIINAGGMGVIMRARQLAMDRDVAVKLLLPDRSERDNTRTRFMREIHLAKQLTHPNTIRLYDYGKHGDFLYLVMELLEGHDLKGVLANDGPLPLSRALDILVQAADAVSEAHERNIVHRDLKPGNLFIQRLGSNRDFVKVLDFGIAKSLDSQKFDVTSTGEVSGTVAYLSPEMVRGKRPDKRADVYALGVLFMEMVTGRKIFEGFTVAETLMNQMQKPPVLPPTLDRLPLAEVVKNSLTKNPDDRYQDAAELLAALNEVVHTVPYSLSIPPEEIDDAYGPRYAEGDYDSSESLGEPADSYNSPGGTNASYLEARASGETVRVRTNEELTDLPSEKPRLGLWLAALGGVLAIGGLLSVVLTSSDAPPVVPTPGPEPVVAVVDVDVGFAFDNEGEPDTGAQMAPSAILPAREVLAIALDLSTGAAQLEVDVKEDKPPKVVKPKVNRPPKKPDPKPREDTEEVEDLDVFGSLTTKKKDPPKPPPPTTPAQLRAAANKAFLAGDYRGCISKCRKALAGGETSCHPLLANAYRQIGKVEAACKHYKAAGIAHKSCITLQSR